MSMLTSDGGEKRMRQKVLEGEGRPQAARLFVGTGQLHAASEAYPPLSFIFSSACMNTNYQSTDFKIVSIRLLKP